MEKGSIIVADKIKLEKNKVEERGTWTTISQNLQPSTSRSSSSSRSVFSKASSNERLREKSSKFTSFDTNHHLHSTIIRNSQLISKQIYRCPGNCSGQSGNVLVTRNLTSLCDHMLNISHGNKTIQDLPRYNRDMEILICPVCIIPCPIKDGSFRKHMSSGHPGINYSITRTSRGYDCRVCESLRENFSSIRTSTQPLVDESVELVSSNPSPPCGKVEGLDKDNNNDDHTTPDFDNQPIKKKTVQQAEINDNEHVLVNDNPIPQIMKAEELCEDNDKNDQILDKRRELISSNPNRIQEEVDATGKEQDHLLYNERQYQSDIGEEEWMKRVSDLLDKNKNLQIVQESLLAENGKLTKEKEVLVEEIRVLRVFDVEDLKREVNILKNQANEFELTQQKKDEEIRLLKAKSTKDIEQFTKEEEVLAKEIRFLKVFVIEDLKREVNIFKNQAKEFELTQQKNDEEIRLLKARSNKNIEQFTRGVNVLVERKKELELTQLKKDEEIQFLKTKSTNDIEQFTREVNVLVERKKELELTQLKKDEEIHFLKTKSTNDIEQFTREVNVLVERKTELEVSQLKKDEEISSLKFDLRATAEWNQYLERENELALNKQEELKDKIQELSGESVLKQRQKELEAINHHIYFQRQLLDRLQKSRWEKGSSIINLKHAERIRSKDDEIKNLLKLNSSLKNELLEPN